MITPEEIEETWRRKSDEEVLAAVERLADYTEVGQRVILAEMRRRGISRARQSGDSKPIGTEKWEEFEYDLKKAGRQNMPHGALIVSRTRIFGLILAVPLIGFLVGVVVGAHLIATASFGAGIVGLALLLGIRLAGAAAHNNRTLLLALFQPGLHLTTVVLIGLILVHAAIAMGTIYYGEAALVGRVHVGIILGIGVTALVGVFVMTHSIFALVRKAQTLVIGRSLSPNEAPELWRHVEQLADQLGALRPDHIVVGLDPNFFVTEADVTCLSGNLSGRTFYCSLPLSRILTASEFSAVIGHELGHFKGLDTKFSEGFYPIYRGTASAIGSLQATGEDSAASIALLPAIAILSYFLESFSVAESRIGRERELAADGVGASITDAATIATALVKLHAFSGLWERIQHAAGQALGKGKVFVNVSKAYAELVTAHAKRDIFEDIAETSLSHPTDSHPPLAVRLESLGRSIDEVRSDALNVNLGPSASAIGLLPDAEKVEEEISGAYQAILARQYGIALDHLTETSLEGIADDPIVTQTVSKQCPVCGMHNQASRRRCKRCGYDFS